MLFCLSKAGTLITQVVRSYWIQNLFNMCSHGIVDPKDGYVRTIGVHVAILSLRPTGPRLSPTSLICNVTSACTLVVMGMMRHFALPSKLYLRAACLHTLVLPERFCSVRRHSLFLRRCFKDAWREHIQVHKFMKLTSPTSCGDLESPSTPTEDDALLPVVNTPSTSNHSVHNRNTTSLRCTAESIPEGWTLVSTDKEYLPSAEDVGCRLRVQVTAEALADGEVLAGPVAIFTDVVLQAPSAPPKRVSI